MQSTLRTFLDRLLPGDAAIVFLWHRDDLAQHVRRQYPVPGDVLL
jgi:hypothetical protein